LTIAGGGLAGCLAALALAKLRPDVPFLLVEQGESFGGNHVWSYFDADVAEADRWLVAPFTAHHWPAYDIAFPRRRRTLPTGYNSARSTLLDAAVRERLRPDQYRLGAPIAALAPDAVTLASGERIAAAAVIDARGPEPTAALELGWQKFVGHEVRLTAPHGLERPIVMDACVEQHDGYRFVYCLPFAPDRLLIEDTYYSNEPALDRALLGRRIAAYAESRGWRIAEVEHEEQGVLPVATGGDFTAFWPAADPVGRLGLRGAFFHPTTGYSLPDAVRTALLVARHGDPATLAAMLRAEAARLWRERGFYRLLSRMLMHGARPEERRGVLEHFYRLAPDRIARFYAGRFTLVDKARALAGKPPIPIARGLRAALS
jgi:lycopene beta-cyclase